MKNEKTIETKKVIAIGTLKIISFSVILSGAVLMIASILNHITFHVLNAQMHGAVFGMVVMFLGVRYLIAVRKLKDEVYKTASQFSWSHFRRQRDARAK